MKRLIIMMIVVGLLVMGCGGNVTTEVQATATELSSEPTGDSTDVSASAPPATVTGVVPTNEKEELLAEPQWRRLGSLRTPHPEGVATTLNGKIYVAGGLSFPGGDGLVVVGDVFEVYDPVEESWRTLPTMPEGRHHLMMTAHNELIYVIGGAGTAPGSDRSNQIWAYDPAEQTWNIDLTPMPEARFSGYAVTLNDFIYVVGGEGETNDLLRYNPAADEWIRLAPLRQAREHTQAVVLNGLIYALAGRWDRDLNSVEIYRPETDTWQIGPPMRDKRAGFAAAVVDGKIYVMGGELIIGQSVTQKSMEVFEPAVGTWEYGPELSVALHGTPVAVVSGGIYIMGGSGLAGVVDPYSRIQVYFP